MHLFRFCAASELRRWCHYVVVCFRKQIQMWWWHVTARTSGRDEEWHWKLDCSTSFYSNFDVEQSRSTLREKGGGKKDRCDLRSLSTVINRRWNETQAKKQKVRFAEEDAAVGAVQRRVQGCTNNCLSTTKVFPLLCQRKKQPRQVNIQFCLSHQTGDERLTYCGCALGFLKVSSLVMKCEVQARCSCFFFLESHQSQGHANLHNCNLLCSPTQGQFVFCSTSWSKGMFKCSP